MGLRIGEIVPLTLCSGEALKALIFDTETTGMVERAYPVEHPSQPHLIQLGMLLVDLKTWSARARHSMLVKLPEGQKIDPGARDAHGISEEDCASFGVPLMVAGSLFNQCCVQADMIVAHNLEFDQSVMLTALYRLGGKPNRMDGKRLICTKEESTDVLKLPGKFDSYKWPTLGEAFEFFTGEKLVGAHDALVDTEACLKIFRQLVEQDVISLA